MTKSSRKYLVLALALISMLGFSTIASAVVDKVICVPWQGDINKQHTAISGQAVQLKGVIKTTDTTAVYYKWVFGDGSESAITTLSGSTKYNVDTGASPHIYTAATGTPFTAKLQVSNTGPAPGNFVMVKEDPYLLKIENNEINAKINISIDRGLWALYKMGGTHSYAAYPHTYDGSPQMTWLQTSYVPTLGAPTASAVHAFAINGHKVTGDPDQDPYVEAVKGGMNYLVKGYFNTTGSPELQAVAIGPPSGHTGDNPDGNGNGYGIQVYGWPASDRTPYQGGQVMDAIIASGVAPSDSTGRDFAPGHTWTYGELLQDMADMHAWGQWDGGGCNGGICGSWWYNWNYSSPGDNSASQWPAIGMIPAQQAPWNVIVPQWVKTYNANWLEYSKCYYDATHSYFGYNGGCGSYNDSALQTTPSGMVQMIFDGQTTADPKWGKSQLYMADSWQNFTHGGSTWGPYKSYGWYSFAKAMRLSLPNPTTQIVKTGGATFDWYYGDPTNATCANEATCEQGLAPRILELQAANGSWDGNLTDTPLSTAWMIIILKPTLFAAAPVACFSASPNPSFPDLPIAFDPSCSGHTEPGKGIGNLTLFSWDWDNDGIYDVSSTLPAVQNHSFSCSSLPCTYPVRLQVTDDNDPALNATFQADITISNPPHPPVANAGGPYTTSLCSNDTLTLDGSNSFDQDQGRHQAGCDTCPNDTITAWDWDLIPPPTEFNNASGDFVTLNPGQIDSFFDAGVTNIGLRVTDNTLLAYPGSGQPNLKNAAFTTVDVKTGCICNLTARPKSGKIQLTWTAVAGGSYDIYRSTAGPNTGFVKIAAGVVTSYATYLDGTAVNGITYYYRVVHSTGCGSNAASAKASSRGL